jgi:S-adenosylmethionine synthetase
MSTSRAIVTGASGLLGREVLKHLVGGKWEVLGLAYSRAREKLQKVDLCDPGQVEEVLTQFHPDVVIHCAAERRPDVVANQQDKAVALNVNATQILADLCSKRNVYLLYISTDYVFDGKAAPYLPSAPTNPINTYGLTKRDGEDVVLRHAGFGVLRVPILYGQIESLSESAVTTLFSLVQDSTKPAKVSDYEQRYPTHVTNCAQVCVGVAEKKLAGIWHYSGREPFTKYTMALAMAEMFSLSANHLTGVKEPSPGAVRPYDCHLDSSATEEIVPITYIPFRDGIKAALEPFL